MATHFADAAWADVRTTGNARVGCGVQRGESTHLCCLGHYAIAKAIKLVPESASIESG